MDYVSDAEIANETLAILNSPEHKGKPIILSFLGTKLSLKFSPWRSVIAGRNLDNIIEKELGNQIRFEGEGSQIYVALASEMVTSQSGSCALPPPPRALRPVTIAPELIESMVSGVDFTRALGSPVLP